MTKKQAIARKLAWQQALSDNRVIRYEDGRLTSYPTIERRDAALSEARKAGIPVSVVTLY